MKPYFLIIFSLCFLLSFTQQFPYDQKWKEIEQQQKKGDSRSLLPLINTIYVAAKKENNTQEIIQALIYQYKIISETQEDQDQAPYILVINNFEKEISESKGITCSVLKSLLAHVYQEYAQNTSWKRRQLTETSILPVDLSLWTNRQLTNKSLELYKSSLENKQDLQKEKIEKWKKIIENFQDSSLYPTLYDILVLRYIQALTYKTGNTPIEEERIKEIQSLFDSALAFHVKDIDKSCWLNYKLLQIQTLYASEPQQEQAQRILEVAKQYATEPYAAYLGFIAARTYKNTDRLSAFTICKQFVYSSKNPWSANCKNLLEELQQPSLQVDIDAVVLPEENIPLRIKATNLTQLYYRIYQVNPGTASQLTIHNSIIQNEGIYSLQKTKIKEGNIQLHNFKDLAEHSTLARLEGLPEGNYLLEFSSRPDFPQSKESSKNFTENIYFQAQSWAIVELKNAFQLINRKTGKPLSKTSFQLYKQLLPSTNKNAPFLSVPVSLTTQAQGIFQLPQEKERNYQPYYIYNPESKTYTQLSSYYYGGNIYAEQEKESYFTSLFTDRSIYRPGQKIYFKGILYTQDKEKSSPLVNRKVRIYLKNLNGEQLSFLDLTSNEYGSVFGDFILPTSGLTGQYSITSDIGNGSANFSIEEYKRPTFQVKINKPEGEATLDKEVTTQGNVNSYAGASVGGAKVVYRVERKEEFPFIPYFKRYILPVSEPEFIAQGETLTKADGSFSISFLAKTAKPKKDKEYRTYRYTVYVEVTDLNGETQSTEREIVLGDLPKKLTLAVPDQLTYSQASQIIIQSENLNGEKEPAQGTLFCTPLEIPKRVLLPNASTWIPDYQLYDKEQFIKYFPYLPYSKEEQDPQYWKKKTPIAYSFNTEKTDTLKLKSYLKPGYYELKAVSMYGKDSIVSQKIIQVVEEDKNTVPAPNLFFTAFTDKPYYKPGETIHIQLQTALKESVAILHIESGNQWIEHKEIPIKNGKAEYSFQAKKEYIEKGLFISSYLLKENGYKEQKFAITIQDKPKDLYIRTKVFRNKILPGTKESWELEVSGKDKEPLIAEVLATMYDASLDQFQPHSYTFSPWSRSLYPQLSPYVRILGYTAVSGAIRQYNSYRNVYPQPIQLKEIEVFGGGSPILYKTRGVESMNMTVMDAAPVAPTPAAQASENKDSETVKKENTQTNFSGIQTRKNLQETAFFYPTLYTNEKGEVRINFTSPEALTQWKLLVLAHTTDLKSGVAEFYTQTQKELMIVPNVPRFLREGDKVSLTAKIDNLSAKNLSGKAELLLFDALTNQPIDQKLNNISTLKNFQVSASKNTVVQWDIQIPDNTQAITYKIVAQSENFSDGEENSIPVLSKRMLVTETQPISVRQNQTKTYRLPALLSSSSSLQNFNLSIEVATNPLWLGVFSLPYLREQPNENSDALFERLYANVLSKYILDSSPQIKRVFEDWNSKKINVSNLEKNAELKNILIQETSWLRNAETETEQKKRISLLFDLNTMSQEYAQAIQALAKRQNPDGGFPWFEGGSSSIYITQSIILGFGQLQKILGEHSSQYLTADTKKVIQKSIQYVDQQLVKNIEESKKKNQKIEGKTYLYYYYVRSFWKDQYPLPSLVNSYISDINKDYSYYFNQGIRNKTMATTTLYRYGYKEAALRLIKNSKETSVINEETGRYWKNNVSGWNLGETPIENQTFAIEAFTEITPKDINTIEEMKLWLLKNKQTQAWNSSLATVRAVYALLSTGESWTQAEEGVRLWVSDKPLLLSSDSMDEQAAGYIKKSWKGSEITPEQSTFKIEKSSAGVAWGGIYWQYFEDMDKVQVANTHIKIQKQLFNKINTNEGVRLQEITNPEKIKLGDLITVRIIVKSDMDMDYIHIKDMRASGFEPVGVLSSYKYQNGSTYYESIKDVATHFFFEKLRKGTYVFEYDVRANMKGSFSNGITQIQSMYAPEMSAHTEGTRVKID